MGKVIKIEKAEDQESSSSFQETDQDGSTRDKHLEGLSGDQVKIIKLMASIFVNTLLHLQEKG